MTEGLLKLILTSWNSPADPADPGKVVSASVGQNLPSTRAGGQDDVSLNKLPQTIQCEYLGWIKLGESGLAALD